MSNDMPFSISEKSQQQMSKFIVGEQADEYGFKYITAMVPPFSGVVFTFGGVSLSDEGVLSYDYTLINEKDAAIVADNTEEWKQFTGDTLIALIEFMIENNTVVYKGNKATYDDRKV